MEQGREEADVSKWGKRTKNVALDATDTIRRILRITRDSTTTDGKKVKEIRMEIIAFTHRLETYELA